MFTVNDRSSGALVTVTAEGLRRVFSSMFLGSTGGLTLSAFGISSVVYFGSKFPGFIEGFGGSLDGVTLKALKEEGLVVGIISGASGGLTIGDPVFTANHCMQADLTCVLGSFFHSALEVSGESLGGCGIVLGGETGYSSNLYTLTGLNVVSSTEVLLCYETFWGDLDWEESTYVHSFTLTLGQKSAD